MNSTGVTREKTVVCYDNDYYGSRVTVRVNFLGLYSIGIRPRLCAGNWSNWISFKDHPVETVSYGTK
ncbi:MAG: hypothetical protein LVQ96_05845 [Thermoplasmatales archaeon]|nr:hypothetical protein [Thermoplasmatales archaeon]MCW6170676.1 hypothetical protein [Thermoplasmatales archaeon]